MERLISFIDKTNWADGPWKYEPDKLYWVDEYTGLDCLIRRSVKFGALFGYVGVPNSHPYFGKDYYGLNVECHGGLTFSGLSDEDGDRGICRIKEEEEEKDGDEKIWWLGFDCIHGSDFYPSTPILGVEAVSLIYTLQACGEEHRMPSKSGEYRTVKYVKNEVIKLPKQLNDIKENGDSFEKSCIG
jgi:hypothetical protein